MGAEFEGDQTAPASSCVRPAPLESGAPLSAPEPLPPVAPELDPEDPPDPPEELPEGLVAELEPPPDPEPEAPPLPDADAPLLPDALVPVPGPPTAFPPVGGSEDPPPPEHPNEAVTHARSTVRWRGSSEIMRRRRSQRPYRRQCNGHVPRKT
jgi:hypothetical protein